MITIATVGLNFNRPAAMFDKAPPPTNKTTAICNTIPQIYGIGWWLGMPLIRDILMILSRIVTLQILASPSPMEL